MSELINLFRKLSESYDNSFTWEQIAEKYEKTGEAAEIDLNSRDDGTNSNAESPHAPANGVTEIEMIRCAIRDSQVLSTLLELCSSIRSLRESNTGYDNTYDCWDQVVKVSPRDSYLAFIYGLTGLVTLNVFDMRYNKLAVAAANTYLLSLTIPGAKGFHIFEEEIIAHVLQVFIIIDKIQNPNVSRQIKPQKSVEIWVNFVTLCDDLKLLLRYVHFSDHKTARDHILKKLVDVQFQNHERGFENIYAVNLHHKCFEIFEEVINAHNGDPEETLMKLMNMTVFLHTYTPKPKVLHGSNSVSNNTANNCDHISDWFIKCIAKYPRILTKVLSFYIECVVTNPIKTWKTDQTLRALEYAAKYDAALFTKCNASSVEFLCDAVYSDEATIRSRAVELMARLLCLESEVNWQMFRHEVSDIPRELHLIKELIDSLKDINNNIKLKAVQALQAAFSRGSPNAQKILNEIVKFAEFNDENVILPEEPRLSKNEIRFSKPSKRAPTYTFEGSNLIEPSILNLPELIYTNFFRNQLSYVRRAGIIFMEHIAKLNPLIIFNTHFVAETCHLVGEPTALVRKQTLIMVDSVLSTYPNCFPVIWVWCKIIAPMLRDPDPKNIELAMDCFRSKVLLNMKGIDQSNKAEHFMPWVIIRTMLSTQSRLYLQTCFHLALQQRMLNTEILCTIESHLLTTNSTEAWIVLNFVAGKIKPKEPDSLIHLFTSLESWNKEQNMLIALEVLASCVQHFSHSALNFAFDHILNKMRSGRMLPVIIGKAFDFLILIDNRSQKQNAASTSSGGSQTLSLDKQWIVDLHEFIESKIISGIQDFPDNRSILLSYLHSYSEVNLQTPLRPNSNIISFIHKFMRECLKLPEKELDLDNERLLNSMILIAGRFSLRDTCIASTTCELYGIILRNIDRPPVVNTIIVAVTDLCKKHTQIVERIIEQILLKLKSPYTVNRIETFKCFESLVLQDQFKLRGTLLLALIATILDENKDVAMRASEFFVEFVNKKNPTLFQKCLIECPFVLNEYKNFEGLDSFAEANVKSPLVGDKYRTARHKLYNYLMAEIDEINLILYFGQLKIIAEKCQHDPLIKSVQGIALVKDILYILRRICRLSKGKTTSDSSKDSSENNAEDAAELEMPAPDETPSGAVTNTATQGAVTNSSGGRGRRRKEITTMADALVLLEKSLAFIPIIYKITVDLDLDIGKYFDDLGFSLNRYFQDYVKYAQPAEFWNKYRKSKLQSAKNLKKSKTLRKRKISKANDDSKESEAECENELNETDDSEKESDEGGDCVTQAAGATISKRKRVSNSFELPMEYLLNPNITDSF